MRAEKQHFDFICMFCTFWEVEKFMNYEPIWIYLPWNMIYHICISEPHTSARWAEVLLSCSVFQQVSQRSTLKLLCSSTSNLHDQTERPQKTSPAHLYILFNYYFSISPRSSKLKTMWSPSLPQLAIPLQSVSSQTCELSHTHTHKKRAPGFVLEFIVNEFLHSFILCLKRQCI